LFGNRVRDEFSDEFLELDSRGFTDDDFDHLLADLAGLRSLGVASLLGGEG